MRARVILPLALALITAGSTASSSMALPSTPMDSSSPPAITSCHSIEYSGLVADPETLVLNCGTTANWPFAQPNGPTSAGVTINHIVFVSQTSEPGFSSIPHRAPARWSSAISRIPTALPKS